MMSTPSLFTLQTSVQDKRGFTNLTDYFAIAYAFLKLLDESNPTRIISPNDHRYIFYQYSEAFGHKITRPLNSTLFIDNTEIFQTAFSRFLEFLTDLRVQGQTLNTRTAAQRYLASNEINKVVYTMQQCLGSISDSFSNPNQSRKRIGQLFENLIKLLIVEIGFQCESRTISVPIPHSPEYKMAYELDLVFSKKGAFLTSESELIHPEETIGSVKTTSKDRIDKIFLDKFLLSRLLGKDLKVIAIFLHDVQRAHLTNSIFGINSTFKTNHFLGYTLALNRLNGVYYVDPRPEMLTDPRLKSEIDDFQHFLTEDIWSL